MLKIYRTTERSQPPSQSQSQLQLDDAWALSWVGIKGPDAQDFLHRLSTANIKALTPGRGARSCFLTATGKIRSYHTVWCLAPGEYAIELCPGPDRKWKGEFLRLIDELTFSEKFTVSDWPDTGSWMVIGDVASVFGLGEFESTLLNGELHGGVRAHSHGTIDFGIGLVRLYGNDDALQAWLNERSARFPAEEREITREELKRLRIENLRPGYGTEINSDANPLELGLLDALPRGKGCYPGQEVIERTISMGAPARRLVLVTGSGKLGQLPVQCFLPGGKEAIGVLTSAVSQENEFKALGLIRKSHASEGVDVVFSEESGAQEIGTGTIRRLALFPPRDP